MESELLIVKRQQARSSVFEVEGTTDTFWVVRFEGSEGLSELFEFEIEVAARYVDFADLVGRFATLRILELDEPRTIHGMILRVEYAGELRPRGLYRFTLVPWTYRLLMRTDCRIFHRQSVQEIVTQVLTQAGATKSWFRFELTRARPKREHCVQYRESDLNFVHRLLEDEGIFYYFAHEERRHVLVMTDRAGGGQDIAGEPELPYHERHAVADRERVLRFFLSEEMAPGKVTVRGFELFAAARVDDQKQAALPSPVIAGTELYDYVGERAQDEVAAQRPAERALEASLATRRRGRGASDCPRLAPGFLFTLSNHPLVEFDGQYAIVRVHHSGEQKDTLDERAERALVYRNEFVCVDGKHTYRAPRVTPRPTVHGVQTATVLAPEMEAVHVDEQGRIKLQFHWDRRDGFDEQRTCWVPVSHAWAGNSLGAMFLPRAGHEVIVEFVEGDPDRPVVTGRLYDGVNAPPLALPEHKSRSTIRTETLDGTGYSELRFEDRPGSEQVLLRAQRDLDVYAGHDRRDSVGRDEHRTVRQDRFERVVRHRHASVGGDEFTAVAGEAQRTVGALQARVEKEVKVEVGGAVHLTIDGAQHVTLADAQHTKVGGDVRLESGSAVHVKAVTVVVEATVGITLKGPGGFVTIDASGVSVQGSQILLNSGGVALTGPGSPTAARSPQVSEPTSPSPAEGDS